MFCDTELQLILFQEKCPREEPCEASEQRFHHFKVSHPPFEEQDEQSGHFKSRGRVHSSPSESHRKRGLSND